MGGILTAIVSGSDVEVVGNKGAVYDVGDGINAGEVSLRNATIMFNEGDGIEAVDVSLTADPGFVNQVSLNEGFGIKEATALVWRWIEEAGTIIEVPAGTYTPSGKIALERTRVNANSYGGIYATPHKVSGSNVEVAGNYGGDGIRAKEVFLRNAVVRENRGDGIEAEAVSLSVLGNVAVDNWVFANSGFGIVVRRSAEVDGANIRGNTKSGIQSGGDVTVRHSLVRGNHEYGIVLAGRLSQFETEISQNTLGAVRFISAPGTSGLAQALGESAGGESIILRGMLADNGGDAVRLEVGAQLAISQTNIISNAGFGVNNLVPTATVNAEGNWWGSAAGPGNAITGTVEAGKWLTAPVTLVASASQDPVYAPISRTVTATVFVQNWLVPTDTVAIGLSDTRGWLVPPTAFTIVLSETAVSGRVPVTCFIPALTPLGTASTVVITATSQTSPTLAVTVSFQVIAGRVADLSLGKTGNPPWLPAGQALTYTLALANAGPDPATGVAITDRLPVSVTFAAAFASQGACSGRTTVVCHLGTLASSAAATVTIAVVPTQWGIIDNAAMVAASEHDPDAWFNTSTASTAVIPYTLYLPIVCRNCP